MQSINNESTIIERSDYDSSNDKLSVTLDESYYIQNNKDNFVDISFEKEMEKIFSETHSDNSVSIEDEPIKNIPKISIINLCKFSNKNSVSSSSSIIYNDEDDEEDDLINEDSYTLLNNFDIKSKSVINAKNIILGYDKRTTIIIHNIPKCYMPMTLLTELLTVTELKGKFNFFYLPYISKKGENFGFAFINFISPLHIILFYDKFNKKYFNKKSEYPLQIYYAKCTTAFINELQSKNNTYSDVVLPLKYYKLFKSVYKNSVCIFENIDSKDAFFRVKFFSKTNIL